MYNNFYKFDSNPFAAAPNALPLFIGKSHNTVLTNIKNGLSNHLGLLLMTGDKGTGKSMLTRSLLNQLGQGYTTGTLTIDKHETLETMINGFFSVFAIKNPANHSPELSTLLFENFLTSEFWSGQKVLLIIDNAHNLSSELLEGIRLLADFKINTQKIIQFVLVGQNKLIDTLKTPKFKHLKTSISLFEELPHLNLQETQQYIHARLNLATISKDKDAKQSFFTEDACHSIYHFTDGVPSLINDLCEQSLIYASEKKIKPICSKLIEEVANGKNTVNFKKNIPPQKELDEQLPSSQNTAKNSNKKKPEVTPSYSGSTSLSSSHLKIATSAMGKKTSTDADHKKESATQVISTKKTTVSKNKRHKKTTPPKKNSQQTTIEKLSTIAPRIKLIETPSLKPNTSPETEYTNVEKSQHSEQLVNSATLSPKKYLNRSVVKKASVGLLAVLVLFCLPYLAPYFHSKKSSEKSPKPHQLIKDPVRRTLLNEFISMPTFKLDSNTGKPFSIRQRIVPKELHIFAQGKKQSNEYNLTRYEENFNNNTFLQKKSAVSK